VEALPGFLGWSIGPHILENNSMSPWRARMSIVLAAVYALASCGSTAPDPAPTNELRILFIGNSLTYVNDLPHMVERLATAVGGPAIATEAVVFGNYSLEDHWNQGDAARAIDRGGWDVVVLQQGPSALPESRVLLAQYAQMFAQKIRAVGARPALYMVWPGLSRPAAWDSVTDSYAEAGQAVDGIVLPAGEALRDALRRDPALELFAGDGFHPAVLGSYLAALVIYARLTEHSTTGIALLAPPVPLTGSAASVMEAAAASALERFGRQ
jgi:hypothetical protein